MKQSSWKPMVAIVAGLSMIGTLSGCGTSDSPETPSDTPTSTVQATELPGDVESTPTKSADMAAISATGGFGDTPTISVPAPWTITTTQWDVLVQGDGNVVTQASLIRLNYFGVNARTGETFDESYSKGAFTSAVYGFVAGFQKALVGQKAGSRILMAIPGSEAYDSTNGNADAGIELGDTLIFVVDILLAEYKTPDGAVVHLNDPTLPTIAGPVSKPTLTMPASASEPSQVVVQPLIKGSGPLVGADDLVELNYAEYTLSDGKMIRQTYGYQPVIGGLSTTIKGWQEAVIGQPMGSRLLVIVPGELAYPQGYPKYNIPANAAMVYVLDILYTAVS